DAFALFRPFRRRGFGDEDVAVGQHVHPARMVEAGGERAHRASGGRLRRGAFRPAFRGRYLDGGENGAGGRGKLRIGADLQGQGCFFSAAGERQKDYEGEGSHAPPEQVLNLWLRRRGDDGVLLAAARERGGDEAVGLLLLDELAQVIAAAVAVLLRRHRLLDDHEAAVEHAIARPVLRPVGERG